MRRNKISKSYVIVCAALLLLAVVGGACSGDGDGNGNGEECNNGVLDPGETCDPGITQGEGVCPTSCEEDSDPCTTVVLVGSAEACTANCKTNPAGCAHADQCCPDGCNNNNDDDCEVECGNGAIEEGEKCDGNCPTSCPSADPCKTGTLTGSADDCDAECLFDDITTCTGGDACCPEGCTNLTDSDCRGEIGEACTEDSQCTSRMCATAEGFGLPGGYCSADCTSNPAVCGLQGHCAAPRFGLRFCNRSCNGPGDCRVADGYACFDADGDSLLECAAVANGTGAIGDPCTTTADCAGGQSGVCAAEESSATPGGYCTMVLCSDNPGMCPGGSHCALDAQEGFCLKDCTTDGDCRSVGYACYDADADGADECWFAGTGSGAVGDACSKTTDCGGGAYFFCFTFWPEGYCTANCTEGEGTTCPGGSNCYDFGAYASCLDACSTNADCRTGYECVDRDGVDGPECFAQ
jgi:hypothetical protein